MLKGIPDLIDPELLYVLASLGHGDELALVDRNYPAASTGQRVASLRGVDVTTAAEAILQLVPIDTFVDEPVIRMGSLPRFDFYDRVRGAYAVIATSEARPYGCFLVTAGVI